MKKGQNHCTLLCNPNPNQRKTFAYDVEILEEIRSKNEENASRNKFGSHLLYLFFFITRDNLFIYKLLVSGVIIQLILKCLPKIQSA